MNNINSIKSTDYILEKIEFTEKKYYQDKFNWIDVQNKSFYKDSFNNIIDENLNISGIINGNKYYFFNIESIFPNKL